MTATANITGRMFDIIMTGSTTAGVDTVVVTMGTASTATTGPVTAVTASVALPAFSIMTCSRSGPAGQSCKESFYWELFSYPDQAGDQAGEAGAGTAGGRG